MTVRLIFHGDLFWFVRRSLRQPFIEKQLAEKTSVKDVIESIGVPHPEMDLILINGAPAGFNAQVEHDCTVEIFGIPAPAGYVPLQRRGVARFVADGHLGKLARDLRLLGFDVAYDRAADDRRLLDVMAREERALLTRDRRLLMHSVVRDGFCPRSSAPEEQVRETVQRFALAGVAAPFTRCMRCNALLEPVDKREVLPQLEPLTKIYYEQFRICRGCANVYWAGSHFDKLETRVARLLNTE